MRALKEMSNQRSLDDIITSLNNECSGCPGKECSICVWKHK